ncbi:MULTISPECIES: hypothetical protein [unclassified Streptomyces]|uniref:hypothetical protein n=1 Tax=unclassified Streptomyces TaxID=2593676 RepID=UPI00380F905B
MENTAFFHADGTSFWSTSRGSSGFAFTLRRASAGSRFTASGTRRPPETAPSADDSPSRDRNGRTVLYRPASARRTCASASSSPGDSSSSSSAPLRPRPRRAG